MTPAVLVFVAAGGLSAPVPAEALKPGPHLAALERKLHGEWVGRVVRLQILAGARQRGGRRGDARGGVLIRF